MSFLVELTEIHEQKYKEDLIERQQHTLKVEKPLQDFIDYFNNHIKKMIIDTVKKSEYETKYVIELDYSKCFNCEISQYKVIATQVEEFVKSQSNGDWSFDYVCNVKSELGGRRYIPSIYVRKNLKAMKK